MIINGNGQQIQVCNLLILNTKNFAWLNWHVARHLTKNIKISPQKILGGWYTTWPLLGPHANAMYTGWPQFITSHLQERGLRLIAYPPPPLPLIFTHTHHSQPNTCTVQTLVVKPRSPKVGGPGERLTVTVIEVPGEL